MSLLDGKVAVVTGAGGGIGRCHAMALAAYGAKVVVNDPGVLNDIKMADEVVAEIKKLGGIAVANYDSVATTDGSENIIKTAMDNFGRLDILVNNAGILRDKTINNMTDEMWDLVINVHLRGTFTCTRAAARVMKSGRIINTTSVAGLKGNFGQSNYSAAKAGIYGLTLTHALEFAKHNITVNALAPLAKTRMTANIDSIPDEWRPEDVSNVLVYLASDKASDINGRIFGVHGKHLFEYKMSMTDGEQHTKEWTVDEIHSWINAPEVSVAVPQPKKNESKVKKLFDALSQGFTADRADAWDSIMHFAITPDGDWTVTIKNKTCVVTDGKPTNPKTVVTVDANTLVGIVEGRVNPSMAFLTGKMKTTNMQDLTKFAKVFHFKKINAIMNGASSQSVVVAEPQQTGLNKTLVGRKYYGSAMIVHPDKMKLYDETVGDHKSPIFPVTFSKELFMKMLKDQDFNGDIGRMVHGEQIMRFHKPLKEWDVITPRGEVVSIDDKSSGQLLTFRQKLFCEGELAVEMDSVLFFKGDIKAQITKQRTSEEAFDGKVVYSTTIDSTLPARYAEASGDDNPIHTDQKFAKSVGFKDVILHGLGTLAIVSKNLPKDMKELRVRFAKPVYPGDTITMTINQVENHVEFIATNSDGDNVLSNGIMDGTFKAASTSPFVRAEEL